MTEITITEDHKLPYGYWYEKPIPEEPRHIKNDQKIIEELKGTMPLSEIARTCDRVETPKYETELKTKVDVLWANEYIWIILYPCKKDSEPIKYEYEVDSLMSEEHKELLVNEKLKEIIYE